MRVADLFGVIGPALAIVAFAQLAARLAGLRRTGLLLAGGAGVLVASLPVGGLPLAAWLRGVVGDLSVASVLLRARPREPDKVR